MKKKQQFFVSILKSKMGNIKLTLFFSFFLISSSSFSQVVEELVQLDTTFERMKVIYKPNINTTYYFKKVAVFADDTAQIAIEKSYTSYGQNGLYKVYYPSGRLKVKTVFANDKINGEWTWYDEKGVILVKGVYKDGVKHGYWAYKRLRIYGRYKKGKKNRKWYKKDVNEKKKKSYYKNGKLIRGEDFGNENTATIKIQNNIVKEDDKPQISKEYKQAIYFLTENIVFKKALKKHFGSTLKEIRAIKKYYAKDKFQFVISSAILPLDITTFIKESQEGKILVTKIDSVLKYNPVNTKLLFFKEGLKENEELYKNSTNVISPMAVYFSEIHQNLIRIDIVKFDSTIGKNNFESRYKSSVESQKFRVLLYFNNDGILKGAEYEKP